MALVVGIEIGGADLLTPARVGEVARAAEAAGFAYLTLDEGGAGRLDPVTVAAFASATTSTIGLVPVVHTAHAEPFHVSNQLSSLDHGSLGRAGWIVGTDAGGPHAEASEVVDAARRLWDSWEDDAIIADEATGRFLDADRMHYVDFHGELMSVRGPALVPRPPQGQVVVFAAEAALRPGLTDVALMSGRTEALLRAAAAAPRSAPRVVAEIEIALTTLDAPWPLGERLRHNGSAADLVALLTRLDGLVDGVRLIPAALIPSGLDADLAVLHRDVLPAFPSPPGSTLRDRFRLERPANRYASLRKGSL